MLFDDIKNMPTVALDEAFLRYVVLVGRHDHLRN